MSELQRLRSVELEEIPETGLAISINLVLKNSSLNSIIELLESIIEIERSGISSDEFWEDKLPNWFVESTKNIPEEELLSNSQLWDFGSWIDGMKQRGWRWWSYKTLKEKTVIYLETLDYPYNVDPFIYVLYCVGIDFNQIEIFEIYPDSETLKVIE